METRTPMLIEWLQFQVQDSLREKFVQLDSEIWTTFLAEYTGFLGKETWINPDSPEEVITVIRWESLEAWKSIPDDDLKKIDAKFSDAMGRNTYDLVASKKYQVRKFSQSR